MVGLPVINECTKQHKKCSADCCRMFTMPKELFGESKRVVKIRGLPPDEQKYFRLHGCKIAHGDVVINLKDYRVEEKDDVLLLWRDCDWLGKDLLCKHNDIKPFACGDLSHDTKSKYYITKNCIYE
jgi:hypothetical protein